MLYGSVDLQMVVAVSTFSDGQKSALKCIDISRQGEYVMRLYI
jgi:hypothetical protein